MNNSSDLNSKKIACTGCGADLKYSPGSDLIDCEYCGFQVEITSEDEVKEVQILDYKEHIAKSKNSHTKMTVSTVKCTTCGASSSIEPNISSTYCPYCSSSLLIDQATSESIIQPESLLPFKLTKQEGQKAFKDWINGLWFAPSSLKKALLNSEHFKGIYIPYWAYNTDTESSFYGKRGEYYYESKTVNTVEDGKNTNKTIKERKIRWRNTSGYFDYLFKEVLVHASTSVDDKYISRLEPWDLDNLVGFNEKYLSGFITEKYQINLEEGFERAKSKIEDDLKVLIKKRIGGDLQKITSLQTNYKEIKFKHILLPIYVSAYHYKGKVYQFVINARTGEMQGNRPWSILNIALFGLSVAVIVSLIYYFSR